MLPQRPTSAAQALRWFEGRAPSSIKMGLERVQRALDELGNPERSFAALHVAGTNGKGSTCAFAASVLRQAGKGSVGLYTSPHLVKPNERISVDGEDISDADLGARILEVIAGVSDVEALTYFELGTLVAFWHFHRAKIPAAVIETGLGGRLDATTACDPRVTVITHIAFDHQQYLGTTLSAIASEKAGIIKPRVPLVLAEQEEEARSTIERVAADRQAPVVLEGRDYRWATGAFVSADFTATATLPLKGPHQHHNAAAAVAAARLFDASLTRDMIVRGLERARWPGRFEVFDGTPPVVLDGAHNPDGVRVLLDALDSEFPHRRVHLVFGVFADKDLEPMITALFPRVASVTLTPVPHERGLSPERYRSRALELNPQTEIATDVVSALAQARARSTGNDVVVVAGSLFLIGQVRRYLEPAHAT